MQAVWFFLSAAVPIILYSGNAEPYISVSQLPGRASESPELYLVGTTVVLIVTGFTFIKYLQKRAWKAMGDRTSLTPDGRSLLGNPDLTGSVYGRPVRARTVTRTKGGNANISVGSTNSSKDSTSKVTYSVVEADLEEPTDLGVMIGRKEAGEGPDKMDFGSTAVETTALDDRFVVVGGVSEELAEEVLSQRSRSALLDLDELDTLTIGDPTETILEAIPDMSGSFLGNTVENKVESELEEMTGGDTTTVAIETKGVLLDPDELERRVEAVSAVADSFEAATDDLPRT